MICGSFDLLINIHGVILVGFKLEMLDLRGINISNPHIFLAAESGVHVYVQLKNSDFERLCNLMAQNHKPAPVSSHLQKLFTLEIKVQN